MTLPTTEAELAAYYAHTGLRPPKGSEPATPAVALDIPEVALLSRIRALALQHGWLVYHTWRSDHSEAGFPDLVLVKPGSLLFAEVKTRTGKLTAGQQRWLDLLKHSIADVEVYVWRPQDWPVIIEVLTRKDHAC